MALKLRALKLKILRAFEVIERPCAWFLMLAGAGSFVAVIFNVIAVGQFKLATLLIAADLMVSGFSAVQESQDEDEIAEEQDDLADDGELDGP